MADKKYSPPDTSAQPKIDAVSIQKLESKLLGHMRLAAEYSYLADNAANIYDSGLIEILTDKFLDHARDTSKTIASIRKLREASND